MTPDRFWIDDTPQTDPFECGFAIVDEEKGGIVAYANDEETATIIVAALRLHAIGAVADAP